METPVLPVTLLAPSHNTSVLNNKNSAETQDAKDPADVTKDKSVTEHDASSSDAAGSDGCLHPSTLTSNWLLQWVVRRKELVQCGKLATTTVPAGRTVCAVDTPGHPPCTTAGQGVPTPSLFSPGSTSPLRRSAHHSGGPTPPRMEPLDRGKDAATANFLLHPRRAQSQSPASISWSPGMETQPGTDASAALPSSSCKSASTFEWSSGMETPMVATISPEMTGSLERQSPKPVAQSVDAVEEFRDILFTPSPYRNSGSSGDTATKGRCTNYDRCNPVRRCWSL